jgi:hypothetical protein
LKPYSDSDANEHRKQPACLVSGFAGVHKDEEKDIENEYNCAGGNTDIAVTNGLPHSVSIFQRRQLISKIAQECVDTGEKSTQTSADIADRQRLSFEVGSRKTPRQAPNPRGDTAQDHPRSGRCSQSLGYGRQRPNLRERHGGHACRLRCTRGA